MTDGGIPTDMWRVDLIRLYGEREDHVPPPDPIYGTLPPSTKRLPGSLQRVKGQGLSLADHGRRAFPLFGVAGRSMPGG